MSQPLSKIINFDAPGPLHCTLDQLRAATKLDLPECAGLILDLPPMFTSHLWDDGHITVIMTVTPHIAWPDPVLQAIGKRRDGIETILREHLNLSGAAMQRTIGSFDYTPEDRTVQFSLTFPPDVTGEQIVVELQRVTNALLDQVCQYFRRLAEILDYAKMVDGGL